MAQNFGHVGRPATNLPYAVYFWIVDIWVLCCISIGMLIFIGRQISALGLF